MSIISDNFSNQILPNEIVAAIFSQFPPEQLLVTAQVCRQWEGVSNWMLEKVLSQNPSVDSQALAKLTELPHLESFTPSFKIALIKTHGDYVYLVSENKTALHIHKKVKNEWQALGALNFTNTILSLDCSENKFLIVLDNKTTLVYEINKENATHLLNELNTTLANLEEGMTWFTNPCQILDLRINEIFNLIGEQKIPTYAVWDGTIRSSVLNSQFRYDDNHCYLLNLPESSTKVISFYCSHKYCEITTSHFFRCEESKGKAGEVPSCKEDQAPMQDFAVMEKNIFFLSNNVVYCNESTPLISDVQSFCLNKIKKEMSVVKPSGEISTFALPCKQMIANREGKVRIQQIILKDLAVGLLKNSDQALPRFQALPIKVKNAVYQALHKIVAENPETDAAKACAQGQDVFFNRNDREGDDRYRYQALTDLACSDRT